METSLNTWQSWRGWKQAMIFTIMVALPATPFSCFNVLNLVWLAAWHTISTLLFPLSWSQPHQKQTPNRFKETELSKTLKKWEKTFRKWVSKVSDESTEEEVGFHEKRKGRKTSYRITLQYKFKGTTFRKTSTERLNHNILNFPSCSPLPLIGKPLPLSLNFEGNSSSSTYRGSR